MILVIEKNKNFVQLSDMLDSYMKMIEKIDEVHLEYTPSLSDQYVSITIIRICYFVIHNNNSAKLMINTNEVNIDELVYKSIGRILTFCFWESDIVDKNNNSLKQLLLQKTKIYSDEYNSKIFFHLKNVLKYQVTPEIRVNLHPNDFFIASFDNVGNTNRYDSLFYDNDVEISPYLFFSRMRKYVFPHLSKNKPGLKYFFEMAANPMIGIVHELYQNTHLWARNDENNKSIKNGLRIVHVRHKEYGKKIEDKYYKFDFIKKYVNSFFTDQTKKKSFIEISIYDTGIGILKKYCTDNFEHYPSNQKDLFEKILDKMISTTSRSNNTQSNHSNGLPYVKEAVKSNKYLIYFRTNKISAYIDGSKHNNDFEYIDVNHESTGTFITILIPIN